MSRAGRIPGTRAAGRAALGVVLTTLAAAAPSPLSGQEPDAAPVALSFEQAVQVARERNPAYLRQLNQVVTSELEERRSFGQTFLPSLRGSLGFGASNSVRQFWEEDSGEIQQGSVEQTSSSGSQSVTSSLTLFDWQGVQGYRASRAETDAAVAATDYQAALLRTGVGRAYFEAVRRHRLLEVEEQALETARGQLAAVRELLRVAARQPTDVLGAELAVLRAEQGLQQARGEARKAGLELREWLGLSMASELALTSDFPAVFDPSGLDATGLVDRAVGSSPRMLEQRARVTAASRAHAAARSARLPVISASGSWNRGISQRDLDAIGRFDLPNRTFSASIGLSLPLFDQFATSAAVGRASASLDNARQNLREAELQLGREVRAAVIDLENAYTAVQVAERSVEIARERLAQGQELYRLGSLSYENLQQMLDAVAREERGLVNARSSFALALLQLEEKVGGPVGGAG